VPLAPGDCHGGRRPSLTLRRGADDENLHSSEFKSKLDSAFALGRAEISNAAGLMQGRFLQRNFIGAEETPAYKAIGEIRGLLDTLNPGKQGDLLHRTGSSA
jgi:hypothetical protein